MTIETHGKTSEFFKYCCLNWLNQGLGISVMSEWVSGRDGGDTKGWQKSSFSNDTWMWNPEFEVTVTD